MGSEKCRLCLCAVNNLAGVSVSIEDEGFYSMIKTVFRFPVPKLHMVGSRNYALVCFQCASSIRNFYYFSKHVEFNQIKLRRECEAKQKPQSTNSGGNDWTLGELIQHFKTGTVSDAATSGENCLETLSFTTEVESTASDNNKINPPIFERHAVSISDSDCEGFDELEDEIHSDVQRNRDEHFESTDPRLSTVKTNQTSPFIHTNDSKGTVITGLTRPGSFKFSLIETEDELTIFDAKLLDRVYFQMVLDWLLANIVSMDSNNRMLEAQDLIFRKEFLVKCSWTGLGKHSTKIEFKSYINVLKLFKEIGSTRFRTLSDRELAIYFKNKLKHAKERLQAKSCHKRRLKIPVS